MGEDNLNGDSKHKIVRIGNTVHRPTGWWTPAVHSLLNYLEDVGFKYAPRVLGIDDEGREVLSFIEGESGKDGWKKIISEEGLRKYAKLVRDYHEAVSNYHPSDDSEWAYAWGGVQDGQIICHGDIGIWNTVWKGDELVGLLDWDFAFPALPGHDFLYALEYCAPFRDDETCLKWHHFASVPDRKCRIEIFADEYGTKNLGDIVSEVAKMQRLVGKYEEILAKRGLQPQMDWVAEGDLAEIEKRAVWTESNRNLFCKH